MIKIAKNWYYLLLEEFNKEYFITLQNFLNKEYSEHIIYPKIENVFNALNLTRYQDVKVVIIGQDPYHEEGQAQGLAFSVPENFPLPPSLKNIYKELKSDLGIDKGNNGDLTSWAKQGVLLLNTVLTVRKGNANSHKDHGWEIFTSEIVKKLNQRKEPIIFVLWGNYAKSFETLIDTSRHYILKAAHPSPLSAFNGFFGCKHFSKINNILKQNNKKEIDW